MKKLFVCLIAVSTVMMVTAIPASASKKTAANTYLDVGEVGETGEGDIDSVTAGVVIRIKKR